MVPSEEDKSPDDGYVGAEPLSIAVSVFSVGVMMSGSTVVGVAVVSDFSEGWPVGWSTLFVGSPDSSVGRPVVEVGWPVVTLGWSVGCPDMSVGWPVMRVGWPVVGLG